MKHFWKKRLPAFLLAVLLVAGTTPTALAANCADGQHRWGSWQKQDDGKHVRTCLVSGCTATETAAHTWENSYSTDADNHWKKCSVCGAEQSHVAHNFRTDLQKDATSHWEQCATCGYRANEGGHLDKNLDGKCDTCGYSTGTPYVTVTFQNGTSTFKTQTNVVKGSAPANPGTPTKTASGKVYTFKGWTTTNPGSSAVYNGQSVLTSAQVASTAVSANTTYYAVYTVTDDGTITYRVDPGDTVSLDRNDFKDIFDTGSGNGSFRYVRFYPDSSYKSSNGVLYYDYKGSDETAFDKSGLGDYDFYYRSSSYGDYPLDELTFEADEDADGKTVTVDFRLYGDDGYVSGSVKFEIDDGRSGGNGDLTYKVEAGETVDFDRDDFEELFDDEYPNDSFRFVRFYPDSSYKSSNGVLYYDYDGKDEEAFTKSDLEDYDFYYRSSSYGDYPLDELTFEADEDADGKTVTLDCRLYGDDDYLDATVEIRIGDTDDDGDIIYVATPGEEGYFDSEDFNDFFQDKTGSSYDIKYVTFSTTDTFSKSNNGVLYANHGKSGEKSFTKSNIEDYEFYYSKSSDGDYALDSLSFAASDDFTGSVTLSFTAWYSSSKKANGKLVIKSSDSTKGDVTYTVAPGKEVSFDSDDFNDFFQDKANSSYDIKYVTFSTTDTLSKSTNGVLYADHGKSGEKSFTKSTIDDFEFYYSKSSDGDYALDSLSFVASDDFTGSVTLSFTAWYSSSKKASGKLVIKSSAAAKGDITYTVEPSKEVSFDREDFNDFFQKKKDTSNTIKYVTFSTDATLNRSATGMLYANHGKSGEKSFTKSNLEDYEFYYSKSSDGDYALDDLSFVASDDFDGSITLSFTAWYSSSKKASGKLVIQPASAPVINLGYLGDILYSSANGATVQIKASDISRFLKSKYPSATLQSVVLGGVPSTGSLYYNYYGASSYGTSRLLLTAANCKQYTLYANPASASQYALTELLYVPSGTNYCAAVPFTAYGTGSVSASGTILFSVNRSAVGEVYGVTPKNTAVTFPASAIYSAVYSAAGVSLDSIQLLKLPASNVGTVYVGASTPANILTKYGYTSGSQQMSQLRFVPATGYTGSVEIPYVAYNSSGAAVAAGKFCLGVVNSVKKFSDVTSSTWCYKYVAELADAKVIDGYTDGSFKPNNTITYGAALKLIMLAAGYPEQQPTGANAFSGYLTKARAEGIVTRSSVDLTKPITRLQVAQLAAGAMKLDKSNLSSVKPFTDTDNPSVQALNAAGIVEGYASGGTSTYKPNNTLTRGQVSAIVWRMRNYQK